MSLCIIALLMVLLCMVCFVLYASCKIEPFANTDAVLPNILTQSKPLVCNKDLSYSDQQNEPFPCIQLWEKPYYVGNGKLSFSSPRDVWIGGNNLDNILNHLYTEETCAESLPTVRTNVDQALDRFSEKYKQLKSTLGQYTTPNFEKDANQRQQNFQTFVATTVDNNTLFANKKQCYGQLVCEQGYQSTVPHPNWWSCGAGCVGGENYTDDECNCACIPEEKCIIKV